MLEFQIPIGNQDLQINLIPLRERDTAKLEDMFAEINELIQELVIELNPRIEGTVMYHFNETHPLVAFVTPKYLIEFLQFAEDAYRRGIIHHNPFSDPDFSNEYYLYDAGLEEVVKALPFKLASLEALPLFLIERITSILEQSQFVHSFFLSLHNYALARGNTLWKIDRTSTDVGVKFEVHIRDEALVILDLSEHKQSYTHELISPFHQHLHELPMLLIVKHPQLLKSLDLAHQIKDTPQLNFYRELIGAEPRLELTLFHQLNNSQIIRTDLPQQFGELL